MDEGFCMIELFHDIGKQVSLAYLSDNEAYLIHMVIDSLYYKQNKYPDHTIPVHHHFSKSQKIDCIDG